MALDAIGVSSSIAGLLSLGITVCQGLLNYYDSYKNAESDIRAVYGSIKALQNTFTILRPRLQSARFREDVKENVEKSVTSCASSLQDLHDELQKIQLNPQSQAWLDHAKAKLRRLQYPFKETTLGKLKAITSDLRINLNLALNVLQM
jgi:ankyrin repeat domain-containing protein 50